MKEDNLTCLMAHKWKGYYWLSDKTEPRVMTDYEPLPADLLAEGRNPFVVEANMVSEDGGLSAAISYADGRQIVSIADVATPEGATDEDESFVAHRMPGVRRLKFKRRWVERDDELCLGWKTLVPAQLIFTGFEAADAKAERDEA